MDKDNLKETFLGINDNKALTGVQIDAYPNPAQNEITIHLSTIKALSFDFSITNVMGQVLRTEKIPAGTTLLKLNISELKNGVFFYTIHSKNESLSKKIIISK